MENDLKKIQYFNHLKLKENKEQLIEFIQQNLRISKNTEIHLKHWNFIINNYKDWLDIKIKYPDFFLINTICDVFNFEDKITSYYLVLNIFKLYNEQMIKED